MINDGGRHLSFYEKDDAVSCYSRTSDWFRWEWTSLHLVVEGPLQTIYKDLVRVVIIRPAVYYKGSQSRL